MIYAVQQNVITMILSRNSAPIINFGEIKFVRGSEFRSIFPHHEKGTIEQMRGVRAELKANRMEENSPYADDRGKVALLCGNEIARGTDTKAGFLLRLKEFLVDDYSVGMDDTLVLEDELVTAGKLLTQRSREPYPVFIFAHGMELHLLAVSMLRMMGLESYPAIARSGGYSEPVIAVLDLYGTPLSTVPLGESHPPLETLQVISDLAMKGVTYAMLAENHARSFFKDMAWHVRNGAEGLPGEEVEEHLELVVDSLYKSYCLWPENPYIENTLIGLGTKMFHILHALGMNRAAEAEDVVKESSRNLAAGIAAMAEDELNSRLGMNPQNPN